MKRSLIAAATLAMFASTGCADFATLVAPSTPVPSSITPTARAGSAGVPTVSVSAAYQPIRVEQVQFVPFSTNSYTGAALLTNPNQDAWMSYEDYTATVYDAAGTVVGSEHDVVSLAPGESRWVVVSHMSTVGTPTRSEFQLQRTKPLHPAATYPHVKLSVVQSNLQSGQHTGLIRNDGAVAVPQVRIEIVYFDGSGSLLGTTLAFIQDLAVGQEQSFKGLVYSKSQPADTKTYAVPELLEQFYS